MVSSDAIVVWLENVRKDDIHIVGGKCANLGELTAKGVTVPPGFAVTADAFRRFLEETKIGEVIQKTLTRRCSSALGSRRWLNQKSRESSLLSTLSTGTRPRSLSSRAGD